MMIEVVRQRTDLFGRCSADQDVLVVRVSLRHRKSKQREHEHHNQPGDFHDPHACGERRCEKPQTRRSDIRSPLRI